MYFLHYEEISRVSGGWHLSIASRILTLIHDSQILLLDAAISATHHQSYPKDGLWGLIV
jgi:uncharacterized protein YhhL (DUF1145 family)